MIIKAYVNDGISKSDEPPEEQIHIFEDAENVIIHQRLYWSNDTGPQTDDIAIYHYLEPHSVVGSLGKASGNCRLIDFTRSGQRCRLYIKNYAYVCNNDGKTIEKVTA